MFVAFRRRHTVPVLDQDIGCRFRGGWTSGAVGRAGSRCAIGRSYPALNEQQRQIEESSAPAGKLIVDAGAAAIGM